MHSKTDFRNINQGPWGVSWVIWNLHSHFLFSFIRPFEQFQTDDMLFLRFSKIFITFRTSKLKQFSRSIHTMTMFLDHGYWPTASQDLSGRFRDCGRSWAKVVGHEWKWTFFWSNLWLLWWYRCERSFTFIRKSQLICRNVNNHDILNFEYLCKAELDRFCIHF